MEGKRVPSEESSNSFMLNEEETEKISQLTSIKTESKVLASDTKTTGKHEMVLSKSKNKKNSGNNMKSSLITNNTEKKVEIDITDKKALDTSSKHINKYDPVKLSKNYHQNQQEEEEIEEEIFEEKEVKRFEEEEQRQRSKEELRLKEEREVEDKRKREKQKEQTELGVIKERQKGQREVREKQIKNESKEEVEQEAEQEAEQEEEEREEEEQSEEHQEQSEEENYQSHQERRVKIATESGESYANQEEKENKFAALSRMTCSTIRSTMESCVDYLAYVFNFYCKLTYSFNKKTTFSEISSKLEQMTISSFMIFCQDFKIKDEVERESLIEIFKRYADFQKYLSIDQFHKVVEEIADYIYSSKISEHEHTEKDIDRESNYKKMLKFLSLHNSKSFIHKMNSLGSNARVKNSKGDTVGNSKKYTFKLTPNNGRSEEQINKEVQERAVLRKEVKDKNIKLHKENKTNKTDSLFVNSQLKKQRKHFGSNLLNENHQTKKVQHANNRAEKGSETFEIRLKDETHKSEYNYKSFSAYYHPSEVLNHKREASYAEIFKLKTRTDSTHKSMKNKENVSESKLKIEKSKTKYSKDIERLKVNEVISLAKKSLLEKGEAKGERILYPSQSFCDMPINSLYCQSSEIGKIKKQLALDTNNVNLEKSARKSAQLREAEIVLKQQIREIEVPIKQSQLKLEQREFLRASLEANKENSNDLSKLDDVLGFDEENVDEYLEKHYELEKNFQPSSL